MRGIRSLFPARQRERAGDADSRIRTLEDYLEAYRFLLTTQLDVAGFERAVRELRGRTDRRVRASQRNENAYVYLHFARLMRGEVESSAEIEGIDRIFFLPLGLDERIAFVSHRRLDDETSPRSDGEPVFEFCELKAAETAWRVKEDGAGETARVVETSRLKVGKAARHYPGLLQLVERCAGRPHGGLLIVRQTVPDTPGCLIVMTRLQDGGEGRSGFSGEDEKDLSALTQMFFQTYRSVRLSNFTQAYRELVNDSLILPAQSHGIESTEGRIEVPAGAPIRPFARFLCFFCDSLSRADVLPEMDNALFFPLNSQTYYLYHNVGPADRPARDEPSKATLWMGSLRIEDVAGRDALRSIRRGLSGASSGAPLAAREARCMAIFGDALDLLCTASSPDAGAGELGRSLDRMDRRIAEFLKALGQDAGRGRIALVTAVEAALFGTVSWHEWGLELLDERFLTYRSVRPAQDDGRDSFGVTGSLLALTILVDHLPLGVLFLNSALAGAFGEEDRGDVQAISRGYLQTFQTRMLADVVGQYQDLGVGLSVSGLEKERRAAERQGPAREVDPPADDPAGQRDIEADLDLYFARMFAGFEELEAGAFFAVDRDELFVYRRAGGGSVEGRHAGLRHELEGLEVAREGSLVRELSAELRAQEQARRTAATPGDQAAAGMRWLYRWALLRSLAPDDPVLTEHPLHEIPVQLFQEERDRAVGDDPKLRSVLARACFEASALDLDFPRLRQLLRLTAGCESLLRPQTGSVMALALFYDALPVGLVVLCSSSFLAFTTAIEMRDAYMATRAFFLPLQMSAREQVISAYQTILGAGGEDRPDYFERVDGFFEAMAKALPTMRAGLFFSLDRDFLLSRTTAADGSVRQHRWTGSMLEAFGRAPAAALGDLEAELATLETARGGWRAGAEAGDAASLAAIRNADLKRLYLRGIRDLFEGGKNPKQYDLAALVDAIFERSAPAEPAAEGRGGLRSHLHVLAEPRCRFSSAFIGLRELFVLREGEEQARQLQDVYATHWSGSGALLAVLVLQEGLPLGIALLVSPFEGSFTEHERIDVDRSARVLFSEGQVQLRDQIILDYRSIVSGLLSEVGAEKHIEQLRAQTLELRSLLKEDELAGYLAVFMDVMFNAFQADPPSTILFVPFTERTLYIGLPAKRSGAALGHLDKTSIETAALDLPGGSTWETFVHDWLRDVYRAIQARAVGLLPSEPPHTPGEILKALRADTDSALATLLFGGQRYDDRLQQDDRHAYLAPFRDILCGPDSAREAGSLIVTALLYDRLPAAGMLVINSLVAWRFTEQDRVDVESVSRAFFLTYRSIRLRREAAHAARLKGMQDMLLGVTHRLKNDLDPTLGVIDSLSKIVELAPEKIQAEVQELERLGLLEAGRRGIAQVKNRFELLRSVISDSAHLRKARPLRQLAERFASDVENYKRSVPLRQPRYQTDLVRFSLNEPDPLLLGPLEVSPDRIIADLDRTLIDVSDGLDEVLAIYAENAVKAVSDPASQEKTIYLWLLESREDSHRIDLLFYDRVLIPREKVSYIQRREVIPMEMGGGSGTGFYNAGNLLALNRDGVQRIESSDEIRGTALWLSVPRLQVEAVEATAEEIASNVERWRGAVATLEGGEGVEWDAVKNLAPARRAVLYAGSYRWSEELVPIILQVFLQRHQNLEKKGKSPSTYQVSIELRAAGDEGIALEFYDNTRSGFAKDFVSDLDQREQFERNHSAASKLGPSGAVGSCFLAMQDRLAEHLGIEISCGRTAARYTAVLVRFPGWRPAA